VDKLVAVLLLLSKMYTCAAHIAVGLPNTTRTIFPTTAAAAAIVATEKGRRLLRPFHGWVAVVVVGIRRYSYSCYQCPSARLLAASLLSTT
jgi:hypothetical protein